MRILFDLRSTGLGNNGGSHTLVRSANTLVDLKHEVILVDNSKNHYVWTPLKARHLIVKDKKEVPSADIVVATGFKSVARTLALPERCGIKCHWIRAIETWQMQKHEIIEKILKVNTIKIVNSVCLRDYLLKYGVKSEIIRPGYDFDELYPTGSRDHNRVILGGLYNSARVHGARKRQEWLWETARSIKRKHLGVKFWVFGWGDCGYDVIDKFWHKPSRERKLEFYNNINVWLAPTKSEGLHLPPAEAMMTGCPVVTTDAELSGTQDYVEHEVTGLVSENNLESFIKCVERLVVDKDLRVTLGENTRKKIESLGDRETNMRKMVEFFERLTSKE